MRAANTFWIVVAIGVMVVAGTLDVLPPTLATHFDGSGARNGWSSRAEYVILLAGIDLGLPLLIVGVVGVFARRAPQWINLPQREIWLTEVHRAQHAPRAARRQPAPAAAAAARRGTRPDCVSRGVHGDLGGHLAPSVPTAPRESPMTGRHSVGLADLAVLTQRILDGSFENRPGCVLEISALAWSQNPLEAQHDFEDACTHKQIAFRVVPQLSAIDWVCS